MLGQTFLVAHALISYQREKNYVNNAVMIISKGCSS